MTRRGLMAGLASLTCLPKGAASQNVVPLDFMASIHFSDLKMDARNYLQSGFEPRIQELQLGHMFNHQYTECLYQNTIYFDGYNNIERYKNEISL